MGDLVPVLIVTTVMGAAVLIVALVMWFAHRKEAMRNQERLAAIEKGIPLPDLARADAQAPRGACHPLYRGIRLLFIGMGLAIALWVSAGQKAAVWGGFVAFIGLGHLVYWLLVGRKLEPGQQDQSC